MSERRREKEFGHPHRCIYTFFLPRLSLSRVRFPLHTHLSAPQLGFRRTQPTTTLRFQTSKQQQAQSSRLVADLRKT